MAYNASNPIPLPSLYRLDELFEYCFFTGCLIRRSSWKICTRQQPVGYRLVSGDGTDYVQHRVVWKMLHSSDPDKQIDHIDGDKTNNRLENLRCVFAQENQRNRKRSRNNTSGTLGVSWNTKMEKWKAYIVVNAKQIHIGVFSNKADAIKARKQAEIELGFHPNHGRVE